VIAGLIVGISLALALVFMAAWASSRALRAWIERPKYQFLDAVRAYDRMTMPQLEERGMEER
jgi:hypothetical protein